MPSTALLHAYTGQVLRQYCTAIRAPSRIPPALIYAFHLLSAPNVLPSSGGTGSCRWLRRHSRFRHTTPLLPPQDQLARAARAWQRPTLCLPACGERFTGAAARAWLCQSVMRTQKKSVRRAQLQQTLPRPRTHFDEDFDSASLYAADAVVSLVLRCTWGEGCQRKARAAGVRNVACGHGNVGPASICCACEEGDARDGAVRARRAPPRARNRRSARSRPRAAR